MFLVLRALIGVTEALFIPCAVALTANAHGPETRSRALAVFATAELAGVVMGGWYGGFVAQEFHWRMTFYSLGAFGILYAIPYSLFLKRTREEHQVETKKSGGGLALGALISVPTYRVLCVAFPAFCFVITIIYAWLPYFLYGKFSLSLAEAGFTATAYIQGATFVGLLAGGGLADWLYGRTKAARLWVVSTGLFLASPCLHLVGNSRSLLLTKVAAVGFGLGSGLCISNFLASSFEVVPSDTRASAVGFSNLITCFVSGLAALLAGLVTIATALATERLAVYPLRGLRSSVAWVMSTLGVGLMLRSGAAVVWGKAPLPFPAPFGTQRVVVAGLAFVPQEALTFQLPASTNPVTVSIFGPG